MEIPPSFLKSNLREVNSSIFGFNDYLTLTSYVPKKNKAVILVSTNHHRAETEFDSKKPVMIIDYNKYKDKNNHFLFYLKVFINKVVSTRLTIAL